MLEHDMMEIGYEYLSKLPNIKIIKKEVPFLSRCIDIVMLNDLDEIISNNVSDLDFNFGGVYFNSERLGLVENGVWTVEKSEILSIPSGDYTVQIFESGINAKSIKAKIAIKKHKIYASEGPVLECIEIESAMPPLQEIATF